MENVVNLFVFEQREIRVVEKEDDPRFVAKDVCEVLGLENSRDALAKLLDDDEKGVEIIYTPGGNQEVAVVNESGLYNLIFRSNKPEAKAFRKWVTSEVLPSIRKTGGYQIPRREWQKLTDNINRHIDRYFTGMTPRSRELDYGYLHEWKEIMLKEVQEAKRELWEALTELHIIREAYKDLMNDDFAPAKLLNREKRHHEAIRHKDYYEGSNHVR